MSINYRPDIDGLRSIAIIPVVLFHAGLPWFSGGFVGVDVFFVISGFLITSIILPKINQGSFRVMDFYEKRVRRLFPALFAVLVFTMPLSFWLLMPQELEDFGQSLAATALFSSNFLFYSESGYFEGPSELKPLLHTWSLAVEEQYYLLFPGLLVLLKSFCNSWMKPAVITVFLLSLSLSVWSVGHAPVAGFYLIPARAWELLMGSLLAMAVIPDQSRGWLNEVLGLLGLLLITLAIFSFDQSTPFPGLSALVPCLGTALVIYSGRNQRTIVSKMLSIRPLVFIGLISYSLYLWHWPLFVFAKNYLVRELSISESLWIAVLAVACGWFSWRYIEGPFRGEKGVLNRKSLFGCTSAFIAVFLSLGLYVDQQEGLPQRLPAEVAVIAEVANDKPADRKLCEGVKPDQVSFSRLCRINNLAVEPTFVLWGDSHAAMMVQPLKSITRELGINGINATSNGCVPLDDIVRPARDAEGECSAFFDQVKAILADHPEIDTIILAARWSFYANATPYKHESAENMFIEYRGDLADSIEENRNHFEAALEDTLRSLIRLNRKVILVGPVPEVGVDVPNVIAKAMLRNQTVNVNPAYHEFISRNGFVLELFEQLEQDFGAIEFYPVHQHFCSSLECQVVQQGMPLYFDDNHLSTPGLLKLSDTLEAIFAGAGKREG